MTKLTIKDFTKKEIADAHKELKNESEPYMYLQLAYMNIVLPYEDGLIIMEALKHATVIKSNYGEAEYIILDEKLKFEGTLVSYKVIQEARVLHLLLPPPQKE